MNINQIRYFLAVATNQSISEAAKVLYITQPALSLQIGKLEKELGYPLFDRKPNGMTLTEAGQLFYSSAERLMEEWTVLQNGVNNMKYSLAGSLAIGLGPRVFSNGLFEPICNFFKAYPEISVTYYSHCHYDPINALRRSKIDIALDRFPPRNMVPDAEIFRYDMLVNERYCALLPPDDPAAGQETFTFPMFAGRKVLTGTRGSMTERIMMRDFGIVGVSAHQINTSDDISITMEMIRCGHGSLAGPASFGPYYHVAAVPITPEINVPLSCIYLTRNQENPRVQLFRKFITDYCRSHFSTK